MLDFSKKKKPLAYQWLLAKSSGLVSYNQFKPFEFQTLYVDYIKDPKLSVGFYPTLLDNGSG